MQKRPRLERVHNARVLEECNKDRQNSWRALLGLTTKPCSASVLPSCLSWRRLAGGTLHLSPPLVVAAAGLPAAAARAFLAAGAAASVSVSVVLSSTIRGSLSAGCTPSVPASALPDFRLRAPPSLIETTRALASSCFGGACAASTAAAPSKSFFAAAAATAAAAFWLTPRLASADAALLVRGCFDD